MQHITEHILKTLSWRTNNPIWWTLHYATNKTGHLLQTRPVIHYNNKAGHLPQPRQKHSPPDHHYKKKRTFTTHITTNITGHHKLNNPINNWTCNTIIRPNSYLSFIPHWALPSDHDFTPRELFQLFGCHPPGTKYPTDKVELEEKEKIKTIIQV